MERKKAPVFVIGCHRSGTNLLYDTLLSSGGFAIYRAHLLLYEALIPRCGDLSVRRNRQKLIEIWLRSKSFSRSGLGSEQIKAKVLAECRSGGDFLSIVMGEIARNQNAARWAAYGPDNALFIPEIKRELPDALFIHIIRDGRDIALSLTKMGGLRPLPWDKKRGLLATALYWEWMIRKGREHGRMVAPDYIEMHYEDLVTKPRETLARLGEFLDHDLDYDRIQNTGIGRVSEPNSSFASESRNPGFNPVGRWKEKLSPEEVSLLEGLIGECLQEVGYPLTTSDQRSLPSRVKIMQALYPRFFDAKLWLKSNTILGRFADTSHL